MSDLIITPSGYAKMILHASKHPTQPLSGLLIGKLVENSKTPHTLFISDVVPLTHSQIATIPHPIVEAGVRMVHSQACSLGCSVVGTYFANERFEDGDLCELNRRMAREVANMCSQGAGKKNSSSSSNNSDNNNNTGSSENRKSDASSEAPGSRHVTLLLDNGLLCSEEGPVATLAVSKMYNAQNNAKLGASSNLEFSTWNRDNGALDAPKKFDAVKERLSALVLGKQQALWDFEEHLENCNARDFYNPWI